MDESEQAFGERIIALIELIMIPWFSYGHIFSHPIWGLFFILDIIFILRFYSLSNHSSSLHQRTVAAKRGGVVDTFGSYRL